MNTLQLVSKPRLSAGPRNGTSTFVADVASLLLVQLIFISRPSGCCLKLSACKRASLLTGLKVTFSELEGHPSCPKPVCCAAALWSPGLRPGLPTLQMSGQAGFLETGAETAPGKQPAPGLPSCKMPFVTRQAPPSGQRLHQEMLYQNEGPVVQPGFKNTLCVSERNPRPPPVLQDSALAGSRVNGAAGAFTFRTQMSSCATWSCDGEKLSRLTA